VNAYVLYEIEDGPDVIVRRIYIGEGDICQYRKEFRKDVERLVGPRPPEPQKHEIEHGNATYTVQDAEQKEALEAWRRAMWENGRPQEFAGWLMRKKAWTEIDEITADSR
jgi:hypothetical protein